MYLLQFIFRTKIENNNNNLDLVSVTSDGANRQLKKFNTQHIKKPTFSDTNSNFDLDKKMRRIIQKNRTKNPQLRSISVDSLILENKNLALCSKPSIFLIQ